MRPANGSHESLNQSPKPTNSLSDPALTPVLPSLGRVQLFSIPMRGVSPLTVDKGLHVETQYDNVLLDWVGTGSVLCTFDGGTTHTHNPDANVNLKALEWWDADDNKLGDGRVFTTVCKMGLNQTIFQVASDDQGNSAAQAAVYHVAPYDRAPGMWVKFYAGMTSVTADVVDAWPPGRANFATLGEQTLVEGPPRLFAAGSDSHVVQFKFIVQDDVTLPNVFPTGGKCGATLV